MAVIQILICVFIYLVGAFKIYKGYKSLEAAGALKHDLDEAEFSKEIFRCEVLGYLKVITGSIFIIFAHAFV